MVSLFSVVGEYGTYQFVYATLICVAMIISLNDSSMTTFFFHDIPHMCSSSDDIVNGSLFSSLATWNDTINSQEEFSLECENNSLNECEASGGKVEYACCYPFHDTVVSEFNLICENLHYKSLAEANLGLGYLVASLIFGQVSDKFGRRKVALYLLLCKSTTNLGLYLCKDYYQFVALFFLNCMLGYGSFLSLYVLLNEMFGSSKRFISSIKVEFSNILSDLLVCWVFYMASSWRHVPLLFSVTSFLGFAIVALFVFESPLWLLSQGRMTEAEIIIRRMSLMNGRPISPSSMIKLRQTYLDDFRQDSKGKEGQLVLKDSALDLFRNSVVRNKSLITMFNWFSVTSGFYVIYLNMTSWHGTDPYLSFTWATLIGVPAIFSFTLSIQIAGRRPGFCFFMTMGALCGVGVMLVTSEQFKQSLIFNSDVLDKLVMAFSIGGKFAFGSAFGALYIWSSELYPTPVRNVGMGLSSVCGRVGLLLVPFALEFGVIAQAVVGMLGFVSAFLSLFLPETLGTNLPQTVAESKTIPLRKCSGFCGRSNRKEVSGAEIEFDSTGSSKKKGGASLRSKHEQKVRLLESDSDVESEHEMIPRSSSNQWETEFVLDDDDDDVIGENGWAL